MRRWHTLPPHAVRKARMRKAVMDADAATAQYEAQLQAELDAKHPSVGACVSLAFQRRPTFHAPHREMWTHKRSRRLGRRHKHRFNSNSAFHVPVPSRLAHRAVSRRVEYAANKDQGLAILLAAVTTVKLS